ncbi:MAG TPA: hypothetical protein VJL39_02365 [Candidatus Paceibacterota bacterium]
MSRSIRTIVFIAPVLVYLMLYASLAYAQTNFVPLVDVAGGKQGQQLTAIYSGTGSFAGYVSGAFKVVLSVAATLAVLRIAWAGYQYMSSDSWGSKSHAKEILGDTVLGIILLLAITLIFLQINPQLLDFSLPPPATT